MHNQTSLQIITPKVSVIVPVYNTELYVERAIVSLMEQTLDDVQFIIINDGSKDNSLAIIKQVIARYPTRQAQVTLISRENLGVAATRAQGMELATGDYVIHLDSDDWAELSWLEIMHNKAVEDDADVVICDYYTVYKNTKNIFRQEIELTNIESIRKLLSGGVSNSNCDKLVRRELFVENSISFHAGYDMGEDFLVTFLVLLNSRTVSKVDTPLYFYNKTNETSLTKKYTKKSFDDLISIINLLETYLHNSGNFNAVEFELNLFKLTAISLHIIHSSGNSNCINYAFNLYPNANKYIISSKMKFLKIIYFLHSLRLTFLCKYVVDMWRFKCS
ncbi:glycosyltransferase [Aeromonas media]|uniref:Glycosyltransferase n=1 Tax=Aeromonas media TaxID=651 RepID=A0AAE7AFB9_AERME|nr:glycosyltransferase family 2 protein [Aeromonas media]QJT30067.1 glycosyltransferase [Aeromonas media]